jgi:N-acetyl-anhydromuramyl-L-alanine amidase AmpD
MNVITNKFSFGSMNVLNPNKVILIILHHRGGTGDVDSIHNQHKKQGWAGIGYHYYVRKDGTVYQGRPIKYVGSHCKGNNSCSIGVCFEGNFKTEKITDEQIKAGKELVKHIKKMYPKIKKVLNHKDLYPTACPVIDLKNIIGGV